MKEHDEITLTDGRKGTIVHVYKGNRKHVYEVEFDTGVETIAGVLNMERLSKVFDKWYNKSPVSDFYREADETCWDFMPLEKADEILRRRLKQNI